MNMQLSKTPIGLDGVPAAETVLSHVDGERGELIIAGERVGDLVRKTGFEGVTARLWSGGTGQPVGEAARARRPGRGPRTRLCPASGSAGNHARPVDRRRFSGRHRRIARRKPDCRMRRRLSARFR